MSEFELSEGLDKNSVFIVNKNHLKNRFDANFYAPEKTAFFEKLASSSHIIKLGTIIFESSYGVLPPGDSYDESLPVMFLRATDLRPDLAIDTTFSLRVSDEYYKHKRARLKDGDILLAVKGATIASKKSVAFVEQAPETSIINGSIFRFQVITGQNPKYISYLLDSQLCKQQMKYNLVVNNAVDYLDKSLIRNLLIPLPPTEIQNQIVTKMDAAYAAKKAKESEAQTLMDSIDDYLLGELGITALTLNNDSAQDRIFLVYSYNLTSGRIDPFYNKPEFERLMQSIEGCRFPIRELSRISSKIINGLDCRNFTKEGIPYLKVGNISKNTISLDNCDCIPDQKIEKDAGIIEGDLLLTRKGSFGIAAVAAQEDAGSVISSEVFKIHTTEKVNNHFLCFWLNSSTIQTYFNRIKTGAIMGHISQSALKRTPVPVLPLEKQNEIVEKINIIRSQAKLLQQEAAEGLELAKAQVEAMILGDG